MKKVVLATAVLGMIFVTSCKTDKDTVVAGEAQEATSASQDATAYLIDQAESATTWRGFKFFQDTSKPEVGHYGVIKLKEGQLHVKDGVLESGIFISDQTSFESHDMNDDPDSKADFDGHMKSPDFLNVEEYPEAKFEISKVTPLAEGDYNTEISGNLDFRGVPKNITFRANVKEEGDKLTIQSEEFKINRQDFGIDFKGGGDSIIRDEVVLQMDVTAKKA
ncbi:MAG: YceI family protein [Weeksellaceae bacterium]